MIDTDKNEDITEVKEITIPKILLIYTGGTIGMINDPKTGELKSFNFEMIYNHIPELERINVSLEHRSFKQPVDSSEMNIERWKEIAETIFENYKKYDGFVVLHGSDTMAYTASAISFMLQGLKKPVIFTGSQLPIGTIRTDGKENLITAIEIAALKDENGEAMIQEVAVYFEYSLYRGNRSSKISANEFQAFDSPNYEKLAVAGVNIRFNRDSLYRSNIVKLELFTSFTNKVALLKLYPGISIELYQGLFDYSKVKGVVIESFGSGNGPSDKLLQDLIVGFIAKGGVVLNVTQCSSGSVIQGKYATSSFFAKSGVSSGKDLTTEAALAKMMYLLGKGGTQNEIKENMLKDHCGELTIN